MKPGWKTKRLGDACQFIDYRGKTPLKTDRGLRLITAKNVKMGFLQREPMEFVDPKTYDSWMTRGIPKIGDVLFTTEAPLANVAQLDTSEKVVFAQRIIILKPISNDIDRTFLKYLLLSDSAQDRIRERGTGATVQGIKASLLKNIEIAYPSVSEQQRIVAVLDKAFDAIATAKANTEKNLQNAHAILVSRLQSLFGTRQHGWMTKRLEECFRLKSGDGLTSKTMTGGPYSVFGGNGVAGTHNEFNLSGDNVIVGRVGALCGNARHITDDIWLTDNAFKVVDVKFNFHNRFLTYLLNHRNLRSLARQAAQPVISNSSLKDLELNFPSHSDQQRIAAELDLLSSETQRLASLYQQKLTALDALKKSLLHHAFTGQLTAHQPI